MTEPVTGPTTDTPPQTPPPMRADRATRTGSALAAGACLAVLIVAAVLRPSAEGHGTHTALGLPSCQWVQMFNKPCPTCGMTTSFAYAADASFVQSAGAQPFGMILAVLTAAIFWGALHTAVTGSRIAGVAMGMLTGRVLLAGLVLLLGAWGYKIATWG